MTLKKYNDQPYGEDNFHCHGDPERGILYVGLTYPGSVGTKHKPHGYHTVHIDQESVRASDGLMLKYDYERDGWSILQQVFFQLHGTSMSIGSDEWVEVAFVQSWGLEREMTPEQTEQYYLTKHLPNSKVDEL